MKCKETSGSELLCLHQDWKKGWSNESIRSVAQKYLLDLSLFLFICSVALTYCELMIVIRDTLKYKLIARGLRALVLVPKIFKRNTSLVSTLKLHYFKHETKKTFPRSLVPPVVFLFSWIHHLPWVDWRVIQITCFAQCVNQLLIKNWEQLCAFSPLSQSGQDDSLSFLIPDHLHYDSVGPLGSNFIFYVISNTAKQFSISYHYYTSCTNWNTSGPKSDAYNMHLTCIVLFLFSILQKTKLYLNLIGFKWLFSLISFSQCVSFGLLFRF